MQMLLYHKMAIIAIFLIMIISSFSTINSQANAGRQCPRERISSLIPDPEPYGRSKNSWYY
ncbi:hypothetical protein CDL12_12737 [Handroanthus impetiginosus]|uniref:Uncharacterized protein n=1 Tax=Handroanthus impetiginosus TaxID=429701 RepID=A0A2G9HAU0_9LAMI|nr:hypothetical protein CDL12_12737 [Handroanthus impetiginosus]